MFKRLIKAIEKTYYQKVKTPVSQKK